jgi:hypothetical protein
VRDIYFRKNDRIYQLADVAAINFVPEKEIGMALYRGKRCVKNGGDQNRPMKKWTPCRRLWTG